MPSVSLGEKEVIAMSSLTEKIKNNFSFLFRRDFLEAKWEYHKSLSKYVAIISACLSIFFLFSDAELFGRFPAETLIPRLAVIPPLIIYLIMLKKVKNFMVLSFGSLLMCHVIHWSTTWATILLPDQSHVGEGILIMHLLFIGASYGTPLIMSVIMHCFILLNIWIPNLFMNWIEDLGAVMSINIPCIIGISILSYMADRNYLDHYEMSKQLEAASVTDALTKIYNRHKLDKLSDHGVIRVDEKFRLPVHIIMIDIDFFKRVNDTYGHEKGDSVLLYVVDSVKACLRVSDILFRWGGEEFLILLPNCSTEVACARAEQIRRAVENGDSGICPVTISLGIAQYHANMEYGEAVDLADSALYEAKRSGRNAAMLIRDGSFINAADISAEVKTG